MTHNRRYGVVLTLTITLVVLSGAGKVVMAAQALPSPGAVVVPLAPAIAEAPRAARARGVFYRQAHAATLPEGPVWLAASPDGQGELCTDDQATITFARPGQPNQTWSHRFTTADRRGIACISPQQLVLAGAGNYTITVVLEDLYPDTFGSRPYFLIVPSTIAAMTATTSVAGDGYAPVVIPTRPASTAPPRSTPSEAPPTAIPSPRAFRPEPPLVPTPGVPPPTVSAADPTGTPTSPWSVPRIVAVPGTVLLGCALALMLLRRRSRRWIPPAATLTGILDLFDRETREARTIILQGSASVEVHRRPLALLTSPVPDQRGMCIARIWPTVQGPMLQAVTADAMPEPRLLAHDTPYELAAGTVVLRYRAQHIGAAHGSGTLSQASARRKG
jgi:hypothetical protein